MAQRNPWVAATVLLGGLLVLAIGAGGWLFMHKATTPESPAGGSTATEQVTGPVPPPRNHESPSSPPVPPNEIAQANSAPADASPVATSPHVPLAGANPHASNERLLRLNECAEGRIRMQAIIIARTAQFHEPGWQDAEIKRVSDEIQEECAAELRASAGQIAGWLEKADSYKANGLANTVKIGEHLSIPEDDSAVGLYKKVLAAQPNNQQALAGLQEIAAFYLKFGQQICARKMYDSCKVEAELGLEADPDNADLKALRQQAHDGLIQ